MILDDFYRGLRRLMISKTTDIADYYDFLASIYASGFTEGYMTALKQCRRRDWEEYCDELGKEIEEGDLSG